MTRVSPFRATVATGLVLGTTTLGVALAPAALAADTLPQPTIKSATVEVGDTITVTGTGCQAPADALHPADVYYVGPNPSYFDGWTTAEADGSWTLEIGMYQEITPGTYQLEIDCDYYVDGGTYPPVTVTVVADGALSQPTTTPAPTAAPPVVTGVLGTKAITPGVAATKATSALTDTLAAPGEKVVRVIKGFQPFEEVTVTLHSTPQTVGTFKADGNGVLTAEFTVPAGTPVGDHTLVYNGTVTYFQESFEVAGAGDPRLAYTGASIALPLALGTGLVALGGGALMVTRRRASGASQA
ncbi:hypothetical protein [Modestobacter sp. SYSU DS0290]